jgi:hypothetical protein
MLESQVLEQSQQCGGVKLVKGIPLPLHNLQYSYKQAMIKSIDIIQC